MSRSTRVVLESVVDGFSRLVELAPGAPEIKCLVNENEASDWLRVGDDLWNAVEEHPELERREPNDDKELVEA